MSQHTHRTIRRVEGRAVVVRGSDIDTDRIMPARFLRCVTFDGLEDHVFEDDRRSQPDGSHPFDQQAYREASILVVNRNFGCGSSREHAPQGLMRWGIRGIVGESFAEIFFGNCVSLGLPCLTLPARDVARLQERIEDDPSVKLTLDLDGSHVLIAGVPEAMPAGLPEGARQSFLSGTWDSTGLLLDSPEEIDKAAADLPYVSRW